MEDKRQKRYKRHRRIRSKLVGNKDQPRLSVFRSNQHIYLQLIDDGQGKTLASASDLSVKKKGLTKVQIAKEVGSILAKDILSQGVKKIVFDRSGYKYHGRVKAVAEVLREQGVKF